MNVISASFQKYGKDAPFEDPVVRCDSCQTMIFRKELTTLGRCPKCGRRKVRNCDVFSEAEFQRMRDKGVDPDFLALFEGVPEHE